MKNPDHSYLHALNTIAGIGSEKLRMLAHTFPSFKDAWHSHPSTLQKAGLSKKICNTIIQTRKTQDPLALWKKITTQNIFLLEHGGQYYPKILQNAPKAPYVLYVRGDHTILEQPSVAIVGSRKFSNYGKQSATRLSCDLAEAGVHIVSGLALGIDAIAHAGALQVKNAGKTIAVLGGGIDDNAIAPRTHINLAQKILSSGGTLISMYPPGTKPSAGTFPARNSIMAHISSATLVIEATHKSGTLITANIAHDAGKLLFAIPGSIFADQSVGANELISNNKATLVQDANTILSKIGITKNQKKIKKFIPKNATQVKIYNCLSRNPEGLTIDKIIRKTKLKGADITQELVILEIDGIVQNLCGTKYTLI